MRLPAFALALAVVSGASTAQPDRSHLAGLTVEELGLAYLECDRRAGQALLGAAEAASCSMVAEELKQRGFGGDFGRLLAWWRAQRPADACGPGGIRAERPPARASVPTARLPAHWRA